MKPNLAAPSLIVFLALVAGGSSYGSVSIEDVSATVQDNDPGAVVRPSEVNLHRDVAALRERMAKLEGSMDILTKFLIDRERERSV